MRYVNQLHSNVVDSLSSSSSSQTSFQHQHLSSLPIYIHDSINISNSLVSSKMPNILIIGATRGLGASLANAYASKPNTTVFGTTRQDVAPTGKGFDEKIVWVKNVDVADSGVGARLVNQLGAIGGGGGMVEGEGGVKGFDVVVSWLLGSLYFVLPGQMGLGEAEYGIGQAGGGSMGRGQVRRLERIVLIRFADHNSRIFRNRRFHKRSRLGS